MSVSTFSSTCSDRETASGSSCSACSGALFTGIVGSLGAYFVSHIYATGQQSNDLEAPMWIVYLAIPLGSYLMCFRFLQVAVHFVRTGELPKHDESHVEGLDDVKPLEVKS